MLITDGAMEDFQDVFEEFNWPERRVRLANEPACANNCEQHKRTHMEHSAYTHLCTILSLQVRVFTYLIGREMTFAENVKWIACNNKGKKPRIKKKKKTSSLRILT